MITTQHNKDHYVVKNSKHELHCEDGPAFANSSGDKLWYINGMRHREDGPAIECATGEKWWFLNDKQYTEEEFKEKTGFQENHFFKSWSTIVAGKKVFHRENGPAIIYKDGAKIWIKNGINHRDGGPAFENPAKDIYHYYQNGNKHRLDGPARTFGDEKVYYIDDIKVSLEDFKKHPDTSLEVVHSNGNRIWKNNLGHIHRIGGPAVIYPDGSRAYWHHGTFVKTITDTDATTEKINHIMEAPKEIEAVGELLALKDLKGPAIFIHDGNKYVYTKAYNTPYTTKCMRLSTKKNREFDISDKFLTKDDYVYLDDVVIAKPQDENNVSKEEPAPYSHYPLVGLLKEIEELAKNKKEAADKPVAKADTELGWKGVLGAFIATAVVSGMVADKDNKKTVELQKQEYVENPQTKKK